MSWFYDYVKVYEPCLSWESCFTCCISMVCYWKGGKKAGVATVCQECGQRQYTTSIFASAN